jgi:hypothetical protein
MHNGCWVRSPEKVLARGSLYLTAKAKLTTIRLRQSSRFGSVQTPTLSRVEPLEGFGLRESRK